MCKWCMNGLAIENSIITITNNYKILTGPPKKTRMTKHLIYDCFDSV